MTLGASESATRAPAIPMSPVCSMARMGSATAEPAMARRGGTDVARNLLVLIAGLTFPFQGCRSRSPVRKAALRRTVKYWPAVTGDAAA
jgi:hypothetical protein